jgi:tetratricopeptide (TPR) repeat protein
VIVSTTLVGPDTLDVLEAALSSVTVHVDRCLVILTDPTIDERELVHAARRGGVKRERLVVRRFEWLGDFSAARNFALEAAAGAGATWAVTVDTDERLHVGDFDLRRHLAETEADLLLVPQADGSYAKERIFRLGKPWRWTGRTHEALPWIDGTKRQTLDGVTFSELAKSPEQLRAKFERDARILGDELSCVLPAPDNARAWYYLGESYMGLDDLESARFAFETCAEYSGWNEEAAWSRYRCADIACRQGRFDDAIEHAALGLTKHAGLAELAWIAGIAAFRARRFDQAIHWATLSASVGWFSGTGRWIQRTGFRYPPALYEGPYDILWHAYLAIGEHEQAVRARARKAAAEKLRVRTDDAQADDDDSDPAAT